ncbi:MAG: radical SAM protein, partial [Anaerolineae bacterium]|nr:radical SAM protein [Anaerolineae bacterium]
MKATPLPIEARLGLLHELREVGVRHIDFTGGEPLLCEDLPALLIEAKQLGFVTSLTTNCVLYPQRHSELKGLVDFLGFSVNGSTPETHNAVYGIECFDQMVQSIELAKRHGEMIHLHATATQATLQGLPSV